VKRIIAAVAAAAALVAIPATADAMSVSSVTNRVQHGMTSQLRERGSLVGFHLVNDHVKCARGNGYGGWTCYGTYTVLYHGLHVEFATLINVNANGSWRTQGNPTQIREW
jgi:hypothetical protein